MREEERDEIRQGLGKQETVSVEAVRDDVEERYGVVYHSKQSYYELREAGGMSYHRSEKDNPKRDEAQILARREEIKKNWHRVGKPSNGERRESWWKMKVPECGAMSVAWWGGSETRPLRSR